MKNHSLNSSVFPLQKHFYTDISSSKLSRDPTIIEFKNGLYQGGLKEYKRNGKGIFLWDLGQVYLGDWENDMIQGFGIVFFPFGGHLCGFFLRNKIQGPGILTFPNGDIHAGHWENGRLEGNKCFFKHSGLWTMKKSGFLKNGKKESTVENQKKILHGYYLLKKSIIENIPKEFLFQEIYDNVPIVINNFADRSNSSKRKIGFLDLNDKFPGYWFYGMLKDGQADGLGLLFSKETLRCKGVFKEGKLEGIGMQLSDLGDIYDGLFVGGDLFIGTVFDNETKSYVFGQFHRKQLVKVYSKGKGFPFEILPFYKHNLYQINLSYYYKYTSYEVLILKESDRKNLYNLENLSKSPKSFLSLDQICMDDLGESPKYHRFSKIIEKSKQNQRIKLMNTPKKSPNIQQMKKDSQNQNDSLSDNLLTFGNEEENESEIIKKSALSLIKDPTKENETYVYFLDDGQPFEPSLSKSCSREKSPLITSKQKRDTKKSNQKPINMSEEKIRKEWKERTIKKNKSLEKLDITVDDSPYKNKYQALFMKYSEKEFVIPEDDFDWKKDIHDFHQEIYHKNHKV